MRRMSLIAAMAFGIALNGRPQGYFNFSNVGLLPTHIGSIDGPLAGTDIWAQMLAGSSQSNLAPVGRPEPHIDIGGVPTGLVFGGSVAVPGLFPGQTAYVEMLAWNGTQRSEEHTSELQSLAYLVCR